MPVPLCQPLVRGRVRTIVPIKKKQGSVRAQTVVAVPKIKLVISWQCRQRVVCMPTNIQSWRGGGGGGGWKSNAVVGLSAESRRVCLKVFHSCCFEHAGRVGCTTHPLAFKQQRIKVALTVSVLMRLTLQDVPNYMLFKLSEKSLQVIYLLAFYSSAAYSQLYLC